VYVVKIGWLIAPSQCPNVYMYNLRGIASLKFEAHASLLVRFHRLALH